MSLFIQTLSHVWESAAWAGDRGLLAKTSPSDAARWLAQTALQLEGGQIKPCTAQRPPARHCQRPAGTGGPERRPRTGRLASWARKGMQLREKLPQNEAVAALGLAGRSLSRGEPAHSSPSCPETCRRSSSPSTIQNRSIFLTLVLFPFEQYHILFIIFGQYNYIVYYINIYGQLYNAHIYEHYIPSLFTVSCLRTADIIFLPFLASLLPNYLRESAST